MKRHRRSPISHRQVGETRVAEAARVACYVRVSTEEQAQSGYSVPAQIDRLEAMSKAQGWRRLPVYLDEGYSGKNLERPAVKRLLEDARKKKFDVVLVYKLDRLSRRLSDLVSLGERFERLGIGLRSLTEPFDTTNPAGKLLFNMLGSFAQFERELIGERTKLGLRRRLREGKWNGPSPFGFRKDKEGRLVLHPQESPYAKRVFQLFMEEGIGVILIARKLNKEDRCTRRRKKWSRTSVWNMLANPVYAGMAVLDGKLSKCGHVGLIPREQFEMIQSRLKENARVPSERLHSRNVLTGLLKCGRCGSLMTTAKGKSSAYYYYACGNRLRGRGCDLEYIAARSLEKEVVSQIREIASHPEMIDRYLEEHKAQNADVVSRLRSERAAIRQRLEALERRKGEKVRWLAETMPDKTVSREVAAEIRKQLDEIGELESKASGLDAKIERLSQETDRADGIAAFLDTFLEEFERLAVPQKRRGLGSLIKEVIVSDKQAAKIVFTLPLADLPKQKPKPKKAPVLVGGAPVKAPLQLLGGEGPGSPLRPKWVRGPEHYL
ncbi:MAG: recombinase family protein [Elusimicrobiota bacterium]